MASASIRRAASLIAISTLAATAAFVGSASAATTPADPIIKQAPPTLVAPDNNTTTPVKDVVLQWTKVRYATQYEVQLSPNGDWTNNTIDLPNSGLTVATTYEVPLSLPHDEYYWRVRGVDANGHTGWSVERQFLHDWAVHLPILKQPTTADPSIAWAPVPEASLYRVRISNDPTFPPPDVDEQTKICWTAGTSYTPYELLSASKEAILSEDFCNTGFEPVNNGTYYYEVVAFDDSTAKAIKAENAPDTAFECGEAQPECDALSVGALGSFVWQQPSAAANPPAGSVTGLAATWHVGSLPGTACDVTATCPTTPSFSWNSVSGANYYRVGVFRDPYATNVYRVYGTQWPSLTAREAYQDAQAGHAYYWDVAAYTCTDVTDETILTCPADPKKRKMTFIGLSSIASFAKRTDAPVLQSPSDGATVKTPTITFRWADYMNSGNQGALEAANYHLQISTTKSFDKTVTDIDTVDMTQWTDPNETLKNGVYFWRLQAVDESGNQLTWSDPREFTFDGAPPQFTLTTKDGLAVSRNLQMKASETDIVGTVNSRTVQVIGVASKKAVAGQWDSNGAGTWTFNPTGLLVPGESYALRVSGLRDQAGNAAIATNTTVRTATFVDDRNRAVSYSSKWSRASSSNAKRGTYSAGSGGAATMTVVGNKISLYGCKGPSFGTAVVSIDGKRQATVHEHQGFTECGLLIWTGPVSSTRTHTLSFAQSSGSVAFDAVTLG